MNSRQLSLIAGYSYLVIFVAAIFGNFFVLDAIKAAPLETIINHSFEVRLGILAFLITAVFDVFVAWALYELYKQNVLSRVSTYFRIIHAVIMGTTVFALVSALDLTTDEAILNQTDLFNTIWLIGLFFFGVHLLLLSRILTNVPFIPWMLAAAGIMYMVDTSAHFVMPNYEMYASVFLTLVAIPSILGEMAFSLWLLFKGGKETVIEA